MAWPFGDTTTGAIPWYENLANQAIQGATQIGLDYARKELAERNIILSAQPAINTSQQAFNPPVTRNDNIRMGDGMKSGIMIGGIIILVVIVWAVVAR